MSTTTPESTRRRFQAILALCATYLVATVATVGFLAWKHNDHSLVTTDAWVHEVILLIFAVVLLRVAKRAAAGNPRAHLRLRIISIVIPIASLAEALIPDLFPTWMRIEQSLYGLCLLVVAALAHAPRTRAAFPRG